jgi:hypothetical protein
MSSGIFLLEFQTAAQSPNWVSPMAANNPRYVPWPCSISTWSWSLDSDTQTVVHQLARPDRQREKTNLNVILSQHVRSYRPFRKEAPSHCRYGTTQGSLQKNIFDVQPNFLFLKELLVCIESVSSHELTSSCAKSISYYHLSLGYQQVSSYANGTSENPTEPSQTVYPESWHRCNNTQYCG